MATLWTFGDSQTFGYGCRPDGPLLEYYYQYKKEGDDVWPNLLAKKLNFDIKNLGICGASNDTILDCMIDNYDKIEEDDYVILGKTFYERFDAPNNNKLFSVVGGYGLHNTNKNEILKETNLNMDEDLQFDINWDKSKLEIQTLINFSYYFATNPLYENRQNKRFNFIKNCLINEKKIKLYFEWSHRYIMKLNKTLGLKQIKGDTKQKINDAHFCFDDHKKISELFYSEIYNKLNKHLKKLV